MAFNLFGGGKTTTDRIRGQQPSRRPMKSPMGSPQPTGGGMDIGPSPMGMPDWLKQKTGGNTGITGGMFNRGGMRSQVEPRMPGSTIREPQPVSTTMPVGRRLPQFDFAQMPQPVQTPMEDSQLWRAYNRLSGGPMAPRMLF